MKLFNSLSEKLEEFKPLNDQKVTIYVCGITPYDTTHLGHAFTYISFDALIRYLKFKRFKVIYTQNVTDINDRDKDILQRAKQQNIAWDKLAQYWTGRFLEDMSLLNWSIPTYYIKASESIPQIIKLIKRLLIKKLAYQVNGSVYLDTSKFPGYGKLSKFSKAKMLKAAKEFEESLPDITLWRAGATDQPKHIPSFPSPFGKGRPGWHVECSAMSMSTLGPQIDIHGGGIDLKFPHHEAEIAQSEGATGKSPFARYWLHTGQVLYRGEKMSKSKGNLIMIADLLKKYSPNAIRWLLLSHHWSKNWEYKEKDLIKAQKNVDFVEKHILKNGYASKRFTQIMDQNLDTPQALKLLLKSMEMYQILGFKIP